VLFDFKIIEEWGFSLGEDACLFDEDVDQDDATSEMSEVHCRVIFRRSRLLD
jgi:hypothetical protein